MKTCSDVMTRNPACCSPGDAVSSAAQMMKSENVGSIPVVESAHSMKLVGIVTDRDLALKVVANERDPRSTRVEEVMSRDMVTCYEDDDVEKAVHSMADHQLRRLPIVDHENRIVGIIAQADIATRLNEPEDTGEMVKEISEKDK